LLDIELDESTRQLLAFPRCGCLAGAQTDNGVADANGLAGFQRQVTRDAVTLVQEPEHRDALGHGRDPCPLPRSGLRQCNAIGLLGFLRLAIAAGRQKERQGRAGDGNESHAQSGVQGW
jgi:hypothetical protein